MNQSISKEDRFRGCLLGKALGDAFGACFEGRSRQFIAQWIERDYNSVEKLISQPPWEQIYYTDDTQMAIGLAEALLEKGEIERDHLAGIFGENYDPNRGYGPGVHKILQIVKTGGDYRHLAENIFPGGSYGNGGAMRVAPLGLFFHTNLEKVSHQARLSSLPTHTHPLGIEGARLQALATALAVSSDDFNRESFFRTLLDHCREEKFRQKLRQAQKITDAGDLIALGNGILAIESVVTAICTFSLFPDSYEKVIGEAILLGGDTDTIAAMAGALSGAYLGAKALPESLLKKLENREKGRDYIRHLAVKLAQKAP